MGLHVAAAPSEEPRPTDLQIIALVRGGDVEAFAILADRHYRQLARHLAWRCGDSDVAADLAQETFAEAFLHLDRVDDDQSFAAWLYGIAHNLLRMHWRRKRVRRLVSLDWLSSSVAAVLPGLQQPDDSERCHERDALSLVLAELSPSLRHALLLHSLDGFTAPEVADILGISRAAAERRISRAKEQFRQHYHELDDDRNGAPDD